MELPFAGHEPVLLEETLELLNLRPGMAAVDCTVGRGGHAEHISRRLGPTGLLIVLDADLRNLEFARSRLANAPSQTRFFHANFVRLSEVLQTIGTIGVDAILADLGLSTNQLFDEQYGLSFAHSMPLDMRIDSRIPTSASDLVNKTSEQELARVLYQLAQERYSRRIARKIVEARRISPITTTDRLADVVRSAIPSRGGAPPKIDPATKTFLALRIAVNHEVENLAGLLQQAPRYLNPGGRLAVISFQSTEDRVVKREYWSAEQAGVLRVLTKKPLTPSEIELARNPRSRSAKLRVAQRSNAPLWNTT